MKFTVAIVMLAVLVAARFGGKCGFSVQVQCAVIVAKHNCDSRCGRACARDSPENNAPYSRRVCVCLKYGEAAGPRMVLAYIMRYRLPQVLIECVVKCR